MSQAPAAVQLVRKSWNGAKFAGRRFSVGYLFAVIFVYFGLTETDTFLSGATVRVVLGQQVIVGVLALGLLVPLVTGTFDLSIGATLGFSLVIVCKLEQNHTMPVGWACVVALLCCAAVGAVNGIAVVFLHINSFIATLGISQILIAVTLILSSNQQIVGTFGETFRNLGNKQVLGLPIAFFYLLFIAVILWAVLEHTPLGRRLYAIGGNPEAARLAGVPTNRLIFGTLVTSGLLSGVAGLIFAAQVGVFDNSFGEPQLFPAFAAVFLGATQIKRRPNVFGTVLSLYVLQFGAQGLVLASSASSYWISPLFNGVALIVAVALASRPRRARFAKAADSERKPPVAAAPAPDARSGSAEGAALVKQPAAPST